MEPGPIQPNPGRVNPLPSRRPKPPRHGGYCVQLLGALCLRSVACYCPPSHGVLPSPYPALPLNRPAFRASVPVA
ncbi:unnamed protein product [Gadus morhua 'NCC']